MSEIERRIDVIGEWLGTGTLNFFGRQFAGKDTQAGKLATRWGVHVLGGGDILRNSPAAADVRDQVDGGELSDTERYRQIVLPYLSSPEFKEVPLLLSAVGRMKGEEHDVIAVTADAGHPIMAVPYLHITEDEAFRRMQAAPSRGRADDTPKGLRTRLDAFNEWTVPVLETYEAMGLLVEVDAMSEADIVFDLLVNTLYERTQQ